MNINEQILEVLNLHSLISITDEKGIITYVNDKFSLLSGYSKNELIGKNHNVVRHPDMSSEVFKDLWETIKSGKTWSGIIKNKKKNDSSYYVKSTISPLFDKTTKYITGYISIRTDVTEIETIKKALIENLKLSKNNIKFLKQYEDSIQKFLPIFKTSNQGVILSTNKTFLDIVKYEFFELKGKECKILKSKKHLDNKDCFKALQFVENNKEPFKQIFETITKDGNLKHLDTIIFPILNENGNVDHMLHIMHDITATVEIDKKKQDIQSKILLKVSQIAEKKSSETGLHVFRVGKFSKLLAELYGLSEDECSILELVAPIHDIGKIAIPDKILNKPGKLTDEEFKIMKEHPAIGYEMLNDDNEEILQKAAIISYTHHEKWDGTGYPRGLKGNEINILGRIVAIADVFDALSMDRVYKKAWPIEDVIEFFRKNRGKHFDPKLIDIFLDNIDNFIEIKKEFS